MDNKIVEVEGWIDPEVLRLQAEKGFSEMEPRLVYVFPITNRREAMDDVRVKLSLEVS